ncbi:MFS transporter, PAT family, beta-lactamase induction signal transducer AmpG [Arboricoccus pini]|uniref:MFS transporter, PAT family, beta-lactamase induction signal transducer AmpG n=1 Tax=Arboricoccus pini TaxID=1963835 RepID=A0A212PZU7_9PROT|nr:MFS transporter, PAT family, beta-lactamase induction signal transducer AmpG [Arboricoccus pini]
MRFQDSLQSWFASLVVYRDPRVLAVMALGFSSGLPLMLIGSTLSFWLREAGTSTAMIGLFGYVFVPYTFKFAWAPIMDRLPLPILTGLLGRRRSWMLLTQLGLIGAIWHLGSMDPAANLHKVAMAAFIVAFLGASQDIVIDAYRVEILPPSKLGAGAGVFTLGYRLAMWCATAGMLFLAYRFGWHIAYAAIAFLILIGIAVVLVTPEPEGSTTAIPGGRHGFNAWMSSAVIEPFADFFHRHGQSVALAILAFISLYKACDVLLTLMANPFYHDVGFSKLDIAEVSGTFGIAATIIGGLLGGLMVHRMGLMRALLVAGILQAASNLMFAALASIGPSKGFFYLTIGVENLSGGMGNSAFIAYLSSLCAIHYTAVQYALLTSFMQMLGKYLIVPASGFFATAVGWNLFFITSALSAIPGLLILLWLQRQGFNVSRKSMAVQV